MQRYQIASKGRNLMDNEKMRAFSIMVTTIVIATIASVNVFSSEADENTSNVLDKSHNTSVLEKIIDTDESMLMGKDSKKETYADVMDELDSMMTYEDELAFSSVSLKRGQTLMCSYGTSEIILVFGDARVYCSGNEGFINISNGVEYCNGMGLSKRQLFIMPSPKNSGAVVISDEAKFLIRGGYEIIG